MEHLDTFLARYPPFHGIEAEQVGEMVRHAVEIELAPGDTALVEDGPPAGGLWVLLSGSMELVHQGEAIQVLEPGECFGHPSLLTGMAPVFTVRARERSRCVLIGAADALRVLGTEAGVVHVARTMRRRLRRTGHTVHGLHDVGTTPVSAIMRPPVFVAAEEPIARAVDRLARSPTLLVRLPGGGLGAVSDAEVRARVAGDGVSLDAPVSEIARAPVPTVPAGQLAIEATIDMVEAGTEQLAVLDGERVCGLVSAADLLGLDARSPIGLRHTLLAAPDEQALRRAAAHLPRLFCALQEAGVPAADLGRVLSLQHDALVARLIEFALARHGEAPLAWAWLDLGSIARRELTLASDQDNGLAYADPEPGGEAEVDAYFARVAAEVNAGLADCGIGSDDNRVLASDRLWRMSKSAWLRTFADCLEQPDESHLIRATVAFDFRADAGGLVLAGELTQRIRAAPDHPPFMNLIARGAAGFEVALGFRGQLATDRDGRLDLKRGAIVPLVNVVRYHALAGRVTISPTLDRITALAASGGLEEGEAAALSEAFEVICRLRFEHHAALIAAGRPPDNLIDPGALTPIVRTELREALSVVRRLQRRLPA